MVQVALPEEVPSDPDGYVRDAASAALDEAERWARQKGLAPDLSSLQEILNRV